MKKSNKSDFTIPVLAYLAIISSKIKCLTNIKQCYLWQSTLTQHITHLFHFSHMVLFYFVSPEVSMARLTSFWYIRFIDCSHQICYSCTTAKAAYYNDLLFRPSTHNKKYSAKSFTGIEMVVKVYNGDIRKDYGVNTINKAFGIVVKCIRKLSFKRLLKVWYYYLAPWSTVSTFPLWAPTKNFMNFAFPSLPSLLPLSYCKISSYSWGFYQSLL